jgi:hypothetical protein
MQRYYFHNNKPTSENKVEKKSTQILKIETKSPVDINILLNRVKIEEKNETKKKVIFLSLVTLALCLFGTFIIMIK